MTERGETRNCATASILRIAWVSTGDDDFESALIRGGWTGNRSRWIGHGRPGYRACRETGYSEEYMSPVHPERPMSFTRFTGRVYTLRLMSYLSVGRFTGALFNSATIVLEHHPIEEPR